LDPSHRSHAGPLPGLNHPDTVALLLCACLAICSGVAYQSFCCHPTFWAQSVLIGSRISTSPVRWHTSANASIWQKPIETARKQHATAEHPVCGKCWPSVEQAWSCLRVAACAVGNRAVANCYVAYDLRLHMHVRHLPSTYLVGIYVEAMFSSHCRPVFLHAVVEVAKRTSPHWRSQSQPLQPQSYNWSGRGRKCSMN
jgi:hypothetical protein